MRLSVFYLFGLLVVAFFMLLLPLVYLALIGAVGFGLYCHLAYNVDLLPHKELASNPVEVLRLALYLAPILVVIPLIMFMVKPLCTREVGQEEPLTLDRAQEPALYAFIEKLCTLIGARFPQRIDIVCAVNAVAGFRGGLLGLLKQDRVLMIGLPLAAGLNLQQFAGVLAHELGHFTQGTAGMMTYLISSINAWFYRVVYPHGPTDLRLHLWWILKQARSSILHVPLLLLVWFVRRVLWALMLIGHAASCYLLRQGEYHADAFEAQVSGADCFATTTRRMALLSQAWERAHARLEVSWRERRLVDNLPALTIANADQFTEAERAAIREQQDAARAGFFSTHPSASARIAAVVNRQEPGVFRSELPATILFSNFKMIAHAVTLVFYRRAAGLDVDSQHLVPVERLVGEHKAIGDEQAVLRRFFQGCVTAAMPVFPGIAEPPRPVQPKVTAAKLKAARQRFQAAAAEARKTCREVGKAEKRIAELTFASTAIRAGFRMSRKEFKLPAATREVAAAALEAALAHRESLVESRGSFRESMRVRVVAALELAQVPAVAARIENCAGLLSQAGRILPALAAFEAAFPALLNVLRSAGTLDAAFSLQQERASVQEDSPRCEAIIRSLGEDMRLGIEDVKNRLSGAAYPFAHSAGRVTLAGYACRQRVLAGKPSTHLVAAHELWGNMLTFYFRSMGRLALLAEGVEATLGMKPLPEVEEETEG